MAYLELWENLSYFCNISSLYIKSICNNQLSVETIHHHTLKLLVFVLSDEIILMFIAQIYKSDSHILRSLLSVETQYEALYFHSRSRFLFYGRYIFRA